MIKWVIFYFPASFFLLMSTVGWCQFDQVDHWETIVMAEDSWMYFPGDSQPPPDWNDLSFDDSVWPSGPGGIGYGDEDDATVIDPVISLYMRIRFNILDTGNLAVMAFHMDYDDAFVAYINGQEIARSNIDGLDPPHDQLALGNHEASMYSGGNPEEFLIYRDRIREIVLPGDNVLSIQVHNRNNSSSDMSAIPFLSAGISDTSFSYENPPAWFIPPIDYSLSELPIISINTNGQIIPNEPRIRSTLGIIDNGPGSLNRITDPFNGYNGWISIEIRGESAQMFPKKSYSFETQDSLGQNNNVSLLGFPEENDWILYGPYSDKTLIKNVLTYKLSRDLGRYATRTRYVELFINGSYQGLYVLMEKIKRDANRVNIANLRETDIAGDQLTGGYILRVDKVDDNDYPPWIAFPDPYIPNERAVNLQFFDPGGVELLEVQKNYIKSFMEDYEMALNSRDYLNQTNGFHSFIDKDALIDFLIINEISKNIDAYIYSTYMYKDRDSKGGKLTMGPVWDFNISYGNVDYNTFVESTGGWMYNEGYRMYWFRRMMDDWGLQMQMSCRWHTLRMYQFSDDRIFNYIDSLVSVLKNPIEKNFRKWPVLGQYVWPNSFIGNTHDEEIIFLKNWLRDRLNWMDRNIEDNCITGANIPYVLKTGMIVFPNPFSEKIIFRIEQSDLQFASLSILDYLGQTIRVIPVNPLLQEEIIWDGCNSQGQQTASGMYLVKATFSNGELMVARILKK